MPHTLLFNEKCNGQKARIDFTSIRTGNFSIKIATPTARGDRTLQVNFFTQQRNVELIEEDKSSGLRRFRLARKNIPNFILISPGKDIQVVSISSVN